MDKKNEKKKESIDEILSDLNGLLNKMPSILDGIKMPEIKPVEFSSKQEPAARREKPAPVPEKAPETREVRREEPAPVPPEEPARARRKPRLRKFPNPRTCPRCRRIPRSTGP